MSFLMDVMNFVQKNQIASYFRVACHREILHFAKYHSLSDLSSLCHFCGMDSKLFGFMSD